MDNKSLKDTIFYTPFMTVLYVFLQNPEKELTDSDVTELVSTIKKSAVNNALRELAELKFIDRSFKGKMAFNKLVETSTITHLKIVGNLIRIQPLIDELVPDCSKIVLFGSRADGAHTSESDFDLFVISVKLDSINKTVRKSPLSEIIQMVIRKPEQMLTFKKDEPALSKEISKGTVLWEKI